jgi:hypothetical protein
MRLRGVSPFVTNRVHSVNPMELSFITARDENLREHVVNNVVLDNAVEDVATDETKFAVNSGSSSLDEGPVLGFVVRCVRVSVVEICDGDYFRSASVFTVRVLLMLTNPVVHPQVWQSVGQKNGPASHAL